MHAEGCILDRVIINAGVQLACAICETRKEKRFCPATHGRICPTCCGTEREMSLDCPSDCIYLLQARRNDPPREFPEDIAPAAIRDMDISEEEMIRLEPFFGHLIAALTLTFSRDRSLHDRDLIAGMSALAQSYEVRAKSGLLYDPPTANPVQQRISGELQRVIRDYEQYEHKRAGYTTVRDSDVFPIIILILRFALSHTSGRPLSRGFLDFLAEEFPEKQSEMVGPEAGVSRLIVP
jgi:hypothetical protein